MSGLSGRNQQWAWALQDQPERGPPSLGAGRGGAVGGGANHCKPDLPLDPENQHHSPISGPDSSAPPCPAMPPGCPHLACRVTGVVTATGLLETSSDSPHANLPTYPATHRVPVLKMSLSFLNYRTLPYSRPKAKPPHTK